MQATGQTDTIYIYEDVVVYDTVFVYDTAYVKPDVNDITPDKLKSISLLQLDTIKHQANLLLISNHQTATFPINHIILDENFNINIKNLESMKKLNFFGVVFIAFQAMVLAQTNYEVTIGSGIWWENGNTEYVDKPYSPLFNIGLFAKRNFTDKSIGLKTGIEYNYLFSSGTYKYDGTVGVWYSPEGYDLENINSKYGAGLHNISIPLLIFYDKYRIQPFVGINYNYLVTGMQTSLAGTVFISDSHNIGLNLGTCLRLNERMAINLEYKHNLTSDYEQLPALHDLNSVLKSGCKLRNAQTKISLVYTFRKKKE